MGFNMMITIANVNTNDATIASARLDQAVVSSLYKDTGCYKSYLARIWESHRKICCSDGEV